MKQSCVWALAGLLLAACGDDEKSKGAEQKAAQQCRDLINAFCDRVTSCATAADILDENYPASELNADCKEDVGQQLPCEDADRTEDHYGECLSDVKTLNCEDSNEALFNDDYAPPPSSCDDVIVFIEE